MYGIISSSEEVGQRQTRGWTGTLVFNEVVDAGVGRSGLGGTAGSDCPVGHHRMRMRAVKGDGGGDINEIDLRPGIACINSGSRHVFAGF